MSLWHKEVTRLNGDLKAYVEVQNDYTGSIRCDLRTIHEADGKYYVIADGGHIDVTNERTNYLNYEERARKGIRLLNSNSWI